MPNVLKVKPTKSTNQSINPMCSRSCPVCSTKATSWMCTILHPVWYFILHTSYFIQCGTSSVALHTSYLLHPVWHFILHTSYFIILHPVWYTPLRAHVLCSHPMHHLLRAHVLRSQPIQHLLMSFVHNQWLMSFVHNPCVTCSGRRMGIVHNQCITKSNDQMQPIGTKLAYFFCHNVS